MYVCRQIYIGMYVHTCILHASVQICIHVYAHMHVYIYINAHIADIHMHG